VYLHFAPSDVALSKTNVQIHIPNAFTTKSAIQTNAIQVVVLMRKNVEAISFAHLQMK